MDRSYDVPSRAEMEAGLALFSEHAGLRVRYHCRWESTRRRWERVRPRDTDGEYRCRAVVFAVGVTTPWTAPIPGLEQAAHDVDVKHADGTTGGACSSSGSATRRSRSRTACCRGRSASCSLRLARSGPTCSDTRRFARGTSNRWTSTCAAASGRRSSTRRSNASNARRRLPRPRPRNLVGRPTRLRHREVIAATGFRAPLQDCRISVSHGERGRIPAQTIFWESVSVPGIYFAGNATLGSPGAQARALVELGLGERLPLQRAHPRPSPGREALRRRAAATARRAGPPRPLPPPRARDRARALDPEGLPLPDRIRAADGLRETGSCPSRSSSTSPAPMRARSRSRWRRTERSTRRSTCACGTTSRSIRCRRTRSTTTRRRSTAARSRSSSSRC